jgi:hypothetical protein
MPRRDTRRRRVTATPRARLGAHAVGVRSRFKFRFSSSPVSGQRCFVNIDRKRLSSAELDVGYGELLELSQGSAEIFTRRA